MNSWRVPTFSRDKRALPQKLTMLTTKTTTTDMGVYYYHPDHIGSASTVTDNNGKFTEHCEYFPYGEVWISESASTNITSLLPFKFTSKELDPETGLYYYGREVYGSEAGKVDLKPIQFYRTIYH